MADNKIPDVIRFGFKDFVINEAKQSSSAKCSACKAVIHEKVGTTSAYTRHLSTSAHQGLRLRYYKLCFPSQSELSIENG